MQHKPNQETRKKKEEKKKRRGKSATLIFSRKCKRENEIYGLLTINKLTKDTNKRKKTDTAKKIMRIDF